MKEVKDRTGEKIGRLTIIRRADDRFDSRGKPRIYWLCECECGTIKEVLGVPMKNLHNRIRVLGWDVERAFTQPYRKSNRNIVV